MKTRTSAAFGFVAALALLSQAPGPSLTIVFPPADSYVSGAVTLVARVDRSPAPAGRVSFYADGQLVCNVDHQPFECAWNAGPGVTEHQIRVVATLRDGQRLVQTIRTKGVAYAWSVDVDAIQVTVTVTDEHGRFVRGLARDAFRVWEDDVPQKITFFASENIPLELTAAVDVSGSMTDAVPQLKETVKKFLAALRPSDKVTVIAFNDNVFTVARASVEPSARARNIDRLGAWGGTALYDVIVRSVEGLGRQMSRRALVTFSDGEDTASHITLQTAEERLQRSDAVVYAIAQGRATTMGALREILDRLARTSGGRSFATENIDELDEAFGEIVQELANQYLLAYTPPNVQHDGRWHRIRVQVAGDYRVRAREGYRTARTDGK